MERKLSGVGTSSTRAFQFPSGQLGHLTPEQEKALNAFRKRCEEAKVYTPCTPGEPPSHDDNVLLRFLRARKFDVEPALKQFQETEQWRKDIGIEELYDRIDINEYEEARRLYPIWTGRRDKRGLPFYVFEVDALDNAAVQAYEQAKELKGIDREYTTPIKMLRLFALYENLTRFVSPWTTATPARPYAHSTPISAGCNVIDIGGLGIRQFWRLKNHLQSASELATKHYPETLGNIFIVGAPSFFPTVWGWVKRWLDPISVSKIYIVPSNAVLSTISELVDPKDIPVKYGGEHEWKFGELPDLDQDLIKLFTLPPSDSLVPPPTGATVDVPAVEQGTTDAQSQPQPQPPSPSGKSKFQLPIGPIKWVEGEEGEMIMLAVGSEDGKERRKEIARLSRKYRDIMFFPPSSTTTMSTTTTIQPGTGTSVQTVESTPPQPQPQPQPSGAGTGASNTGTSVVSGDGMDALTLTDKEADADADAATDAVTAKIRDEDSTATPASPTTAGRPTTTA